VIPSEKEQGGSCGSGLSCGHNQKKFFKEAEAQKGRGGREKNVFHNY